MIQIPQGRPRAVTFAANATLKHKHFNVEQLLVATAAGITLTLPTPSKDLNGKSSYVINASSGALTLSGAFPQSGTSCVLDSKTAVILACLQTGAATYTWNAIGAQAAFTGLAETIADTVGAMVSSNTESLITVAYQDADNTLDFTVDCTATPTASKIPLADGSGKLAAGWGGAASTLATLDASVKVVENPASATATPTAASIPISDGSGKLAAGWGGSASTLATLDASSKVVENPASATTTPAINSIPLTSGASTVLDAWISSATASVPGLVEHLNWGDFVPTWTFATADPQTNVTKVGRYMHIGNCVIFYCSYAADDGQGGTLTHVTLPVAPSDVNTFVPLHGYQKVNATWTNLMAYVDAETDLRIEVFNAQTNTDDQACAFYISGMYEVAAT